MLSFFDYFFKILKSKFVSRFPMWGKWGENHLENRQTVHYFLTIFLQTDFSNSTKSIERLAEQSVANVTYECYENFTIYYPLYNNAKFWIEGVLLILVGTLGLFGNFLTLAVLSQSKKSTFNQLLIALSICDRYVSALFKTSIFVQKIDSKLKNFEFSTKNWTYNFVSKSRFMTWKFKKRKNSNIF